MRKTPANSGCSGFTLVELIVVIIILAIAAAIAVPSLSGTASFQATSAARMIAADLEYAQNTAITYQQQVTVAFDTGAETYSLSNQSGPLIHPMSKSAYTVDFTADIGLDQVDVVSASFSGSASVTFDELGTPSNLGSVTVRARSHVLRVDVAAATGNVTVTDIGS